MVNGQAMILFIITLSHDLYYPNEIQHYCPISEVKIMHNFLPLVGWLVGKLAWTSPWSWGHRHVYLCKMSPYRDVSSHSQT